MHNINLSLLTYLNNFAGRSMVLDDVVVFITNYLAYGVVVLVFLYFFIQEVRVKKTVPAVLHHMSTFFYMSVSFLCTWLVVEVIKMVVAHPRPFQVIYTLTVLSPFGSLDSFPSAHTALTSALAMSVFLLYRRFGILLLFFAFVVGISRIYVGVHFPVDVFFGFLLGIAISTLFYIVLHGNRKIKSQ